MKSILGFKSLLLFLVMTCACVTVNAQLPADMSKVKASQISDAQLSQLLQQAQSSGMGEAELIEELQKRGLPESEIEILTSRVKELSGQRDSKEPNNVQSPGFKRTYKGDMFGLKKEQVKSRVFGAELFSGAEPLFVPDLKIATPKNYELGPEDELQLDIYGNNISNQKLIVSPDGFVNVKYAGPVNVNGLSIEQASGIIRSRLLKYYPSLSTGATKLQLTLGSVRSIRVMIIGAVKNPGSVTLPSVATLFNALYASGGPLDNGSFRNIELVRNSKVIAKADLYEFIMRGDQTSNLSLRDNDVIRVPFAAIQIILDGKLNRVGIFEMREGETLSNALEYSGGFSSNAFKGRITGTRYTDIDRKVIDVSKEIFNTFKIHHGDSLYVDSVVNRFENRVQITGAVFKPGSYSLESGLDVKKLVEKAQGLKEDAFVGRANMVRLRDDMTKEYKSVDLKQILIGVEKIELRKEDSLHIVSILELRDSSTVSIYGPVKKPGTFRYEDSLTLESLILQAGGFQENATPAKVEIGRRKQGINPSEKGVATSEIFTVDLNKNLSNVGKDIILSPFDIVNIKLDPTKIRQVTVKVSGEILYAGNYTLENPEERLSSIVNRAGGFLPYADINGAKLIRQKLNIDTAQIKRLALSNIKLSSIDDEGSDTSKLLANEDLESKTTEVALDLTRILEKPGSIDDITLQDGDELIIPKFNNTVSVGGEILKPVTVQFEQGKGFSSYISAGGGYTRNAFKKRAFIVYPNGRSAKTGIFLGIRAYPKVTPGSSIFVPLKPEDKGFDPAKAGILVSAFSAIMTAVVLFFR